MSAHGCRVLMPVASRCSSLNRQLSFFQRSYGGGPPQKRNRVPGDHELFVGSDDVNRDLAVRLGNKWAAGLVCGGIKIHAEPRQLLSYTSANAHRVLANTRGEDEGIETV